MSYLNSKQLSRMGAVIALGFTTSVSVFAQTGSSDKSSQSLVPFTSYGYAGASIGRTDYNLGGCTALSCDDKATGFKLYTGGRFSRYLGVELGYVNFGEVDRNGGEVKAQGVNLGLIGTVPITDRFSLLGKIGGIYGWTKTSTAVPGLPNGNENGLGLSYGAGAQFDVTKTVGVRADWDRYRLKYAGRDEDADLYSLGVVFKF